MKKLKKIDVRLGAETPLLDKNGNKLHVGDKIEYDEDIGYLLSEPSDKIYCFVYKYSNWYGDDIYDYTSYGKAATIPVDNGARMSLKLIEAFISKGELNDEKEI